MLNLFRELAGLSLYFSSSSPKASSSEDISDKDMFYCFVELGEKDSDVFIIPAKKVSQVIKASYKAWLKAPGKKGQAHNETVMRWIT